MWFMIIPGSILDVHMPIPHAPCACAHMHTYMCTHTHAHTHVHFSEGMCQNKIPPSNFLIFCFAEKLCTKFGVPQNYKANGAQNQHAICMWVYGCAFSQPVGERLKTQKTQNSKYFRLQRLKTLKTEDSKWGNFPCTFLFHYFFYFAIFHVLFI